MYGSSPLYSIDKTECPIHHRELIPQEIEYTETIKVCPEIGCNHSIEINSEAFNITLNEAKALLRCLSREYISKDPYEDYEQLMRLMNGLGIFIDENSK